MISIIVATDKNGLIGKGEGLPWNFSEDLQYFKKKTMGKFVVLGKRTFLSLKNPLKGRKIIVLSEEKLFADNKVTVAKSIEEALSLATGEVMIAGGASVYEQFLKIADRIYLTVVNGEYEGDVYFPVFKKENWKVIKETKGRNEFLKFQILEREKKV